MAAPTSTRLASCSTNASPGECRSWARATPTPRWHAYNVTPPICRSCVLRCRTGLPISFINCSPATPTTGQTQVVRSSSASPESPAVSTIPLHRPLRRRAPRSTAKHLRAPFATTLRTEPLRQSSSPNHAPQTIVLQRRRLAKARNAPSMLHPPAATAPPLPAARVACQRRTSSKRARPQLW